jgi:trans-aconitate methyltransferase
MVDAATPRNPVGDWHDYYEASRDKPLHPLYAVLEPHLPASGHAIELGCGVGNGVQWLLERGLDTVALDVMDEALVVTGGRTPPDLRPRLELACCDMRAYPMPPGGFDVVVAGFSLFFLPVQDLPAQWERISRSLRDGGLFMGQLLGENDDWADHLTTQSRPEVGSLLSDFEVLHLEAVEKPGRTAQGTQKNWHVFHFLCRRRLPKS